MPGLGALRYTMTGTYFTGRLRRRYGLNVLVAEGEHQDNLHNALYAELARGTVLPATRVRFRAAIADLVAGLPRLEAWPGLGDGAVIRPLRSLVRLVPTLACAGGRR